MPVLDSVTVCAALLVFTCWSPKVSAEGESDPIGLIPLPDRATLGVVGALLFMVSLADAAPAVVGVKPTSMVQLPAGGTLTAQLLRITLKKGLPLTRVEVTTSAAVPVFVTVTIWSGALVLIG